MPFSIVGYAFFFFFLIFSMQVLMGRLRRSAKEDRFIFLLYVIIPGALFLLLYAVNFLGWAERTDAFKIYLLFFVISSSWVASYPAVYATCPTLIMSYVIWKNKHGTLREELRRLLDLKANSIERIEDATHNKFIRLVAGRVEIAPVGRLVYLIYRSYRRALGLKMETV